MSDTRPQWCLMIWGKGWWWARWCCIKTVLIALIIFPFMFRQDDGTTKLVLEQEGVPEDECERTEKGWRNMLLDPMNSMLGGRVIGA